MVAVITLRLAVAHTPTSLDDLKAQLGLLPQPVAYALAIAVGIALLLVVLKLVRKVVGKIIGIVVSVLVSIGMKLFLADPQFHIWVTSLFR